LQLYSPSPIYPSQVPIEIVTSTLWHPRNAFSKSFGVGDDVGLIETTSVVIAFFIAASFFVATDFFFITFRGDIPAVDLAEAVFFACDNFADFLPAHFICR